MTFGIHSVLLGNVQLQNCPDATRALYGDTSLPVQSFDSLGRTYLFSVQLVDAAVLTLLVFFSALVTEVCGRPCVLTLVFVTSQLLFQ